MIVHKTEWNRNPAGEEHSQPVLAAQNRRSPVAAAGAAACPHERAVEDKASLLPGGEGACPAVLARETGAAAREAANIARDATAVELR